jgi:hypothetical protein
MAFGASDVIDEARGFHLNFDPVRHPNSVCLAALRRAQMKFYDLISQISPGELAVDTVFNAAAISAGITGTPLTMPDYLMILPTAVLANNDGLFSVGISQEEESGGQNPGQIRMLGRNLYLGQPTAFQAVIPSAVNSSMQDESPFKDATGLRVTYVPIPTDPVLGSDMDAPDDSRDFMVGSLVMHMAMRDPTLGREKQVMAASGQSLIDSVIGFYTNRGAAESRWYVSRVG